MKSYSQKGQSLIEVLVAMGIFVLAVSAVNFLIIDSYVAYQLSQEMTLASFLAEEGIEAARSIRDESWNRLISGEHGLAVSENKWNFQGSEEDVSQYLDNGKRKIIVTDIDPDRKKIISQINWDFSDTRTERIEMVTYLTNWLVSSIGDWSMPFQESNLDIPGNNDGLKIQIQGDYAYFIRNDGAPDFIVVDIVNPTASTIKGTLDLPGTPKNIAVFKDYAYIANTDNAQELQIIDIFNPDFPFLVGSYDAAGSADANGVFVKDTTVFLVRTNSADGEFLAIDISKPAEPILIGSLDLGATAYGISVMGNYAYIASGHNNQELQVINISEPRNPVLIGWLDLSGNTDAITIVGFTNRIIAGQGNFARLIDVSAPTAPILRTSFDYGGTVNDISLGNTNNYLFSVTSRTNREFQVVDISKSFFPPYPAPVPIGFLNIDGSNPLRGIAYAENRDRVLAVGDSNNEEFIVIAPR